MPSRRQARANSTTPIIPCGSAISAAGHPAAALKTAISSAKIADRPNA
jgi:hypothetical protein